MNSTAVRVQLRGGPMDGHETWAEIKEGQDTILAPVPFYSDSHSFTIGRRGVYRLRQIVEGLASFDFEGWD